jgi:putative endonuclease
MRGAKDGSLSGGRQRWLGRGGELVALVWMVATGYRVRDRNWRCTLGELDLVVERRGEVAFVEVKTRSSGAFGGAVEAVDRRKRERMIRAAEVYCSAHGLGERPCRFDVLAVQRRKRFPWWQIEHVANAFRPDRGRVP